jgi:hypothetical protein
MSLAEVLSTIPLTPFVALATVMMPWLRVDSFSGPILPKLPSSDVLEDATVLVAGGGPLYAALSTG